MVLRLHSQKELIQLRCEARLKYSPVRMTISGSEAATSSCTYQTNSIRSHDVLTTKWTSRRVGIRERGFGKRLLADMQETDIREKDKNKAKNDKTEHGNVKS
ncbi:hypothetical protein Tco_1104593, partial [Tanacetum coccineum]